MKTLFEKQSMGWILFTRVAIIVGLIASITAIIGFFFIWRSETKTRKIEIEINSADQLTAMPTVEGFSGEFLYKGIPVVDLWRIKTIFINSGNATLVGEGLSSMLLRDNISIQFPSETTILDIDIAKGDFYTLTQVSPNSIQLYFTQWKPNENFGITIYLTANKILENPPIPAVPGRPIINGDINITTNLSGPIINKPKTLLDYFKPQFIFLSKIMSSGVIIIVVLFIVLFNFIINPDAANEYRKWYSENKEQVTEIANKLELSPEYQKKFLENPTLLRFPNYEFQRQILSKTTSITLDKSFYNSIPLPLKSGPVFNEFLSKLFGVIIIFAGIIGVVGLWL